METESGILKIYRLRSPVDRDLITVRFTQDMVRGHLHVLRSREYLYPCPCWIRYHAWTHCAEIWHVVRQSQYVR